MAETLAYNCRGNPLATKNSQFSQLAYRQSFISAECYPVPNIC